MSSLTLYGAPFSSYVRSVATCLFEKGVEFQREDVRIPSPELAAMNPLQRIPVIRHGEFTLFESAAICRYVDRAFSGPLLSPEGSLALAHMDQWISVINCDFDAAIVRRYVIEYAFPSGADGQPDTARIAAAEPRVIEMTAVAERALGEARWFSGKQFGIADCLALPMFDYLAGLPKGPELLEAAPKVRSFLAAGRDRQSFQGALAMQ